VDFQVTTYWAANNVQNTLQFAFDEKATPSSPSVITYKTFTFPYSTIGDNEYAAVYGNFTYKFARQGTFSVWYSECCRLGSLKGGANLPFKLTASVIVDGTYRSSPIVSVPPVLTLGVGINSIPLITSEPVTAVSFSPLSESGLACDTTRMNCTVKYSTKTGQPMSAKYSTTNPAVQTTADGIRLVWETTAADIGMWAVSIKVSTVNGFSEADFIANIASNTVTDNTPYIAVSPDQAKFAVNYGDSVHFTVTCNSPKASNMALVIPVGYPGLTVGGTTANRIAVTRGTPVDVVFKPQLNYGGGNQAYLLSFICLNLDTYVSSTYPTQIAVYVGLPLIVIPPPTVNIDCHPHCGCLDPSVFGIPNVSDGCCGTPTITYDDKGADGSCDPYNNFAAVVITRTWTVTNKCGQKDSKTQLIVIKDDKKPTIDHEGCPDTTVQCPWEADDLANYGPTATDTCTDVTITYKDDIGYNKCNMDIKRKWTATDDCGNYDTFDQIITVKDTTPPTITEITEKQPHVECPYETDYFQGWVMAIDNCFDSTLVYVDEPATIVCGTFKRTWTATDECGNVAHYDVTFDVSHTNKPTITPNTDYSYPQCIGEVDFLPCPTGKSYCGSSLPVKQRKPTDYYDSYGCYNKATRYWITTDECGNIATYDEDITVKDTTKPAWTYFQDEITVECDYNKKAPDDYSPSVVGGTPTAADNCKRNVTIQYVDDYKYYACKSIITRTWSATDSCGNVARRDQKIYIVDTTPPEGDAPCDVEIQCLSDLYSVQNATLGRDCSKAYVTYKDDIVYNAYTPCENRKIRRTFRFFDECNNERYDEMYITVNDTVPPVFGDLCNITVECRPRGTPDLIGWAFGYDNCGGKVTATYDDSATYGQYMDYIDRWWIISDSCGNKNKILQRIKLNNTKPFLECPSDITVPCSSGTHPNNTGYASASDQCTGKLIPTWTDDVSGTCPKTIRRTWSASDDITKQSGQCVQIIKVGKDSGPHLKVPPDVTVQCKYLANVKTTGAACSSKICDEDVITNASSADSESGIPCKPGYHINRKWTTCDNCQHCTSGTQVINIWDKTKPVFTYVPPDFKTHCRFNMSDCGKATAKDNCDADGYPVKVEYSDSIIPSEKVCPSVITRVWTATDCTGNQAVAEQTIHIYETGPYFPESYYSIELPKVECEDCLTIPDITAFDTCGKPIKPTYTISKTGSCPTTITVTWTAVDDCGRVATLVKYTTVDDKVPPTIDYAGLGTVVVECEADIPTQGSISVSDNCPNTGKPSFIDVVVPTDCSCKSCSKTVNRYWKVSDYCGNYAYYNQTIIAEKKKSPKLTVPPNVTIECGNAYTPDITGCGTATAEDSCGAQLQVSFKDSMTTFKNGNIEILRTWYATDNCGHTSYAVQNITILGTIGDYSYGYVFRIPPNRDLPCGGDVHADEYKFVSGNPYGDYTNQDVYLTSYCGVMTVTYEPIVDCPAKPGQYVRVWHALRNGVVVATKEQYISVADCPPRGSGITGIPATPCDMKKQSTITPYLSVVDLDLPCEVVTVVWSWGDGKIDTVVCTPGKKDDKCDFTGNQLTTKYTHTYSATTSGVYAITALVYGARHVPQSSYGAYIGPDYIIFAAQFTTINTYAGTVSGSAKFQYDSEYSVGNVAGDYSCAKPWIVKLPGYGSTAYCSGYPSLEMSATFNYDQGSYTPKASGITYFTWANCGGGDITFRSDNLLHLSIFADGQSALWTGTGAFGNSKVVYNFTVFVIDGGKSGLDKIHFRIFDGYTVYLDTDPCMPSNLFDDWRTLPSRVPLTFLAAGLDSDVTVRNPSSSTVSALTTEGGSVATPTGLIVGIVAGIMVFIVVVATVVYFLLRRQQNAAATTPQQRM